MVSAALPMQSTWDALVQTPKNYSVGGPKDLPVYQDAGLPGLMGAYVGEHKHL